MSDITIQRQNFCRNIRLLRRSKGLFQKEMARMLDISTYCLRKIESGTIPPSADIYLLYNIHETFGILPGRLFEDDLEEEVAPRHSSEPSAE